jgi:flotillin
MELERLRATTVVQAKIQKESSQQKADAELYAQEKAAEGKKYGEQADAEAAAFRRLRDAEADYAAKEREAEANFLVTKRSAEAEYFRKERDAQALLIAKQREAEGLSAMAKAYGDLATVLGGPAGLVRSLHPSPPSQICVLIRRQMQYLMLTNGTYERLADANANAIKGLQPKINVWNTGASGDGAPDSMAPIRNLFQSLPPLLTTIQDQTGMAPPSWLAQMPTADMNGHAGEGFEKKHVNGYVRNGSEAGSS